MAFWAVRPTFSSHVFSTALRLRLSVAPAGIRQSRRAIFSKLLLPSKPSDKPSISGPGRATPLAESRTVVLDGSSLLAQLRQTRPYSTRPRFLPSGASHPSQPNLHSTFSFIYSSAAVTLLVLATWATVRRYAPTAPDHPSVDTMSPTAAAPGHIGNLTAEQEEKLRKLWDEILKLCGVADSDADANGSIAADAAPAKPAPVHAPEDPESPQKRRFSLFRRKNIESSQASNSSSAVDLKDGAETNDKYGQTKQFQKTLESQTPESIRETIWSTVKQDNPDALVLRFLRARKWDVQQALVMLVSAMDWRYTVMHVDSDIIKNGEAGAVQDEQNGSAAAKKLAGDFMAQSRQGKSFLHGTDKEGRPICVVRARLHKPSAQSAESLERYTVFIIETARLSLQPPVDTATIIFDMTGFSMANMDYHPVKFMIQCFEANYPESLGAVLVHNAPWVFQGIWRIIRGWLDPVVAAKVHFTNFKAGLEEFIEPGHIIQELQGDEDWEYKYEEPVDGENDRMKDTKTRDLLMEARAELYKQFEAETLKWIHSPDSDEGKQAKAQRQKIAEQMRVGYWELDPYLRSRSLYDRQGIILPGGGVDWYKSRGNNASAPQTNGTGGDASASTAKEA